MEVILLQRVEKLGIMGDIVNVKPGYARNFLIPRGLADRATKDRIEHFESMKKQYEAENLKQREEAEKLAKKLEGTVVEFIRSAGETGNLYGSIRRKDLAEAVTKAGFSIHKDQVKLGEPIKVIGLHNVMIQLHPEVTSEIVVNIAKSEDEAKAQLRGDVPAEGDKKSAKAEAAPAPVEGAEEASTEA